MNITAIIPARKGSKGINNKNIKKLGDWPLIAYSIAAAKLSNLINEIIVSTNSVRIAKIAKQYCAKVPFLRPDNISMDQSTDLEFFEHFISFYKKNDIQLPEIIVHLRPTTPLREIGVLDKGIELMINNNKATSLRSVYRSDFSPYKVFKKDGDYLKGFFPNDSRKEYYNLPRQVFPKTYIPNGYVDIVRLSSIQNGALHGNNILGYEVDIVPDIDGKEDFNFAIESLNDIRFIKLVNHLKKWTNQ